MTPVRRTILEQVALALPPLGRVAVDGVDGAGKTTFADELADLLRERGATPARVRLDDFLNPPTIRHRRGRRSPSGYWADSFDYDRFRAALPRDGLVVVDGVFLQRPELTGEFAFVIFLDVTFEQAAARMAVRDGTPADPDHPRLRRYTVAQRRYLADLAPRERADVVVDNNDVDNPVMTPRGFQA